MKRAMKPSHPGALLREDILREMNLTITKAAEGLGISSKTLSELVNENAGITTEMALRIERAFGVDAGLWLDMQATYDLWKAPDSGKVPHIHRIKANKAVQGN